MFKQVLNFLVPIFGILYGVSRIVRAIIGLKEYYDGETAYDSHVLEV